MRARLIATGLLLATGAGAAVAQIAGNGRLPVVGPAASRTVQIGDDVKLSMEVDRLGKEVLRLTAQSAALEQRLAMAEGKAATTVSRLDTLQNHFENHRHYLKGYTAAGLSSAQGMQGGSFTYLTPYKTEAEIKDSAITYPPMK